MAEQPENSEVANVPKMCEVLTTALKIPCAKIPAKRYKATCQNNHARIKWACDDCVYHPNLRCSTCIAEGVINSKLTIEELP